jgi:hypothetical protein
MKTNHKRGFRAETPHRPRYEQLSVRSPTGESFTAKTIGGDYSGSHVGEARQKRGAKKFLRSRVRNSLKRDLHEQIRGL